MRFGVIVVEVLFPLCDGELTHVPDKQILFVVTAEPVCTEEAQEALTLNETLKLTNCAASASEIQYNYKRVCENLLMSYISLDESKL